MAKLTSWEEGDKKAAEATQGTFLRLENDGDKAIVVFRPLDDKGELCVGAQDTVWNEKLGKAEDYNPQLHAGKNPSTKFTMNAYCLKSGNGDRMFDVNASKLITMNAKTYKLARASMEKYCTKCGIPIDGGVFEMERKGKKGDTSTTYTVLPEEPKEVSKYPGLAERVKAAKFLDPEKDGQNEETAQNASSSNGAAQNGSAQPAITFIAEPDTQTIMARIKAMPEAAAKLEKFKTRFGIVKIRELKATDVPAALRFLDELEGKAPGVVDPFEDA